MSVNSTALCAVFPLEQPELYSTNLWVQASGAKTLIWSKYPRNLARGFLSLTIIPIHIYSSKAKKHMLDIVINYQENVINAGLSASGNNKWLAVTVAIGRIATKSVISQPYGMNGATAKITMPAMPTSENMKENLNFLSTLGTSIKKLLNSASLDVAPQVISISNMWASRAWETWRERPPRKIASIRVHLKFSKSAYNKLLSPIR